MAEETERVSEMRIENDERVGKDHGEDRGRAQGIQAKHTAVSRTWGVLAAVIHEKAILL